MMQQLNNGMTADGVAFEDREVTWCCGARPVNFVVSFFRNGHESADRTSNGFGVGCVGGFEVPGRPERMESGENNSKQASVETSEKITKRKDKTQPDPAGEALRKPMPMPMQGGRSWFCCRNAVAQSLGQRLRQSLPKPRSTAPKCRIEMKAPKKLRWG